MFDFGLKFGILIKIWSLKLPLHMANSAVILQNSSVSV